MSYAVSITQDGTVLNTAGKYVDQDIVVGMSDSIKKAAATYTPTTADQTIAAGQYLSGAQTVKGDANLVAGNIKSGVNIFGVNGTLTPGITPSGTKNITANGTYDVTEYASAAVNVPTVANLKRWTVNIPSDIYQYNQNYTILSGDPDIAAHYADSTAAILLLRRETFSNTSNETCAFSLRTNHAFYSTDSQNSHGAIGRVYSGAMNVVSSVSGGITDTGQRGSVAVNSSGDVLFTYMAATSQLRAGTYDIIFFW